MRFIPSGGRTAATFAAAALALACATGSPASAAPPVSGPADCYDGWVCFWPQANYGGQMEAYQAPYIHSCDNVPSGTARSVVNRDDQTWSLSQDFICNRIGVKVAPGEENPDLGADYYYWK
ncbi:peptidase inhibitor family I36 protein [Streptomyces brevispora]|uniref:peptidase inhibitor family I36 protein n=1 Tax=Streptomyces brevispora TaxID=887462 RepID=UPI002E2F7A48|nr:peptidase inhibitor family I36 protein [Streptomyces brevispora]